MLNQSQISQEGKENFQSHQKSGSHPFFISREGSDNLESFRKDAQWSLLEKAKFAAFLQLNTNYMSGKKANKLWKKFEEMEEFIKTRNFRQCKLYHQRLLQHYETIPDIVTFLAQGCNKFQEIKEREKENFFRRRDLMLNRAGNKNLGPTAQNYQNQADVVEHQIEQVHKKSGQEILSGLMSKIKNFKPITFCA